MFTERLKDLREEKNLTQKKLADMLSLSKNSICEYEKGRSEPSILTLIKLADILDCSIDYLVGRTDDFGVVKRDNSADNDEFFTVFKQLPTKAQKYLIESANFLSEYSKR